MYKSARPRAMMVYVMLVVYVALSLMSIVSAMIDTPSGTSSSETVNHLILLGIWLKFSIYFLLYIFFVAWLYRIHCNLIEFVGVRETTPGDVVMHYISKRMRGGNLLKQYADVRDAWTLSSPEDEPQGTWLEIWWFFWYLPFPASMIEFFIRKPGSFTYAEMVMNLIGLVSVVLTFILVRRLTALQDQKWQAINDEAARLASLNRKAK